MITFDPFESCQDPKEAWASRTTKSMLQAGWKEYLCNKKDWKVFITLTFLFDKTPEEAIKRIKWLIRELNKDLLGSHYSRRVEHSYFSYFYCVEFQNRGVLHFHLVVDQPINMQLATKVWHKYGGLSKMEKIVDVEKVISYSTKAVWFGDDIEPYFAENLYIPDILPSWWHS